MIEGAIKFQINAVVIFVDCRRAFDNIDRRSLRKIFKTYRVHLRHATGILSLYKDTSASVLTSDGVTELFGISSGVLQGTHSLPSSLCSS